MSALTIFKALLINCLMGVALVGCTIVQAPAPAPAAPVQPATPQAAELASLRGSTMSNILAAHERGVGTAQVPLYRKEQTLIPRAQITNYTAYTRQEQSELNGLFPRLPNPDLCMYVYPHLSGEGSTIPGYTSCFPMYKTNQYAMPGETQ